MPAWNPKELYEARATIHRAEFDRVTVWHDRLSVIRGIIFLLFLITLWVGLQKQASPTLKAMPMLPIFAFIGVAIYHEAVLRQRALSERAIEWNRQGIGRINQLIADQGEIAGGIPVTTAARGRYKIVPLPEIDDGARYLSADHLYAADLDLFGPGSLFQRIGQVRTRGGADCLASWMKEPTDRITILDRQAAIKELCPKLELRETICLLSDRVPPRVNFADVADWATQRATVELTPGTRIGTVLSIITVICFVAWLSGWIISPFLFGAALIGLLYARYRKTINEIMQDVDRRSEDLGLLTSMLARLESEQFHAPLLTRLSANLQTRADSAEHGSTNASTAIHQLKRLVHLYENRKNAFFAPIAFVLCWDLHLARRVESWRRQFGIHVPEWLASIQRLEALLAISGFAFDHPNDTYPTILAQPRGLVRAEELAHPLLPKAVANNLTLGESFSMILVSGSNMSGKSTLLRTLGSNLVLGMLGAPVRAKSLEFVPCQIAATLRIQDSLSDGRSRFMAEVVRIRALLDLLNAPIPLLFLLDELFHGTNSHDRLIGAKAVLGKLLAGGAIGIVTTHDLSLTALVDHQQEATKSTDQEQSILRDRTVNCHLVDHFENGELVFDYKLRPGVVPKSNALVLMRAVGIDIPSETIAP